VRADDVAEVDAVLPEETMEPFDARKTAHAYKVAPVTAPQLREVPLNVREVGAAREGVEASAVVEAVIDPDVPVGYERMTMPEPPAPELPVYPSCPPPPPPVFATAS
jgi:hypothetical protein